MNKNRFYRVLAVILTLTLFFSILGSADANAAVITKQAKQVAKIVNKERTKRNKGKVTLDKKLTKLANKRAKECAKLFSHTRPNGEDCFSVLKENGVTYMTCGENIAAGQSTAKQVMNSWMHSAGHKKNILTKGFHKIGVGYYKKSGSPYKYYWVQIFTD